MITFDDGSPSLPMRDDPPSAAAITPINFLDTLYSEANNLSALSEDRKRSLKSWERKKRFVFDQPVEEKNGEVLRGLLLDKVHAYNYMESKYNSIKGRGKHITVLPVSFYLHEDELLNLFPKIRMQDGWVVDDISVVIKYLRNKVTALLNKLKHRSIYSRFTGYTQLLLLNESGLPYVQINFFISGEALASFYPEDINNVWLEITKRSGSADFYIFSDEELNYEKINYKHGRNYFPGDDYFVSNIIESMNELPVTSNGDKPKRHKSLSLDMLYRKFFFLVSCRYTRIPGQRTLSSSTFTYLPARKKKREV